MSSIRNVTASTHVPSDLARRVGLSGINEILMVLWQGFHDLKNDNFFVIDSSTEEDDITQELFAKILRIWDSRNRATVIALNDLLPHHQYADSTMKKKKGKKSPTIDFCFKDWNSNSYFGAEAKNLYEKKPDKIKRYIDTGINNYTSGRYGSQSSEGSVIGYVLSGSISTIIDELKNELMGENPLNNLTRVMTVSDPQYKSLHLRVTDGEEIKLHHLFFNFVA
jgi:hypothetical protein